MALSREGIANVRSKSSEIKSLSSRLQQSGENLKGILQSNGNYQFFKAGTDKGMSVDRDLNILLDTMVNQLVPEIAQISSTIENFCAKQERLNRAKETIRGNTKQDQLDNHHVINQNRPELM